MRFCGYLAIFLLNVLVVYSVMSKDECGVTTWTQWSVSGQYTDSRSRTVVRLPSGGLSSCPPLCETRELEAHCEVSEWSNWGGNFGFGQQIRTRNVTQKPTGAGKECPELVENRYITCSIGASNFRKASKEISHLIGLLCPKDPFDKVDSAFQYNQAAMLTFSSSVYQNFEFDDYATTEKILEAVSKAKYYGGGTNTAEAFRWAIGMFQYSKGARNSSQVKPEVLKLTDGQSNNGQETLEAVEELRKVADVYGLMIGGFTTRGKDELTAYVSAPINEHLFYVESYIELEQLVRLLFSEKHQKGIFWCAPFDI